MSSSELLPTSFRTALAHDADAVADLHAASWRRAYRGIVSDAFLDGPIAEDRRAYWRAALAAPDAARRRVVLAERAGEAVGFVAVLLGEAPGANARVENLHVRPDDKGRGLGRALMARAARWVRERAPGSAIDLWVFEANAPARRFYDAIGGEVVERGPRPTADGGHAPGLRYVFRDLAALSVLAPG